jgi:hypothetical protein
MLRPRNLLALTALLILTAFIFAFGGCTTILGDFEVTPSGGGLGQPCTTGAQCPTGFCADGVCCDTACTGICETCALPDKKGTCSPHLQGTDPDKECKAEPRPDAGTSQPQAAEDAGLIDGSIVDGGGGSGDAGVKLNIPDGGLTGDDNVCAGSCDGNRKCAFPGKEKVCGTQFCNSASEEVAFACDQKGLCELGIVSCGGFTCQGNACKKQCAAVADCEPTHFCNNGQCQPRLANGLVCQVGTQCQSGFCVDGVCCNSECNQNGQIPGGTCKKSGREGTCVCTPTGSATECANGCRLFYRDVDNDKHGDKNRPSTGIPENVQVGCVGTAPPTGYALVKDDCNDAEPRAFPGQLDYFQAEAVGGGWDFNCDGNAFEKETDEYPNATCGFCRPPLYFPAPTCGEPQSTCSVGGERANLDCILTTDILRRNYYCDGPRGGAYAAGFVAKVPCGQTGHYVSCSTCTLKGGGPNRPYVDNLSYPQRCR